MIFQFPIYFGDFQPSFWWHRNCSVQRVAPSRERFIFQVPRVAGCRLHPMAHDVSRCLDGIRKLF
jgi:hypothetical protein